MRLEHRRGVGERAVDELSFAGAAFALLIEYLAGVRPDLVPTELRGIGGLPTAGPVVYGAWLLAAIWCAMAVVVVLISGPRDLSRTRPRQVEPDSATDPVDPSRPMIGVYGKIGRRKGLHDLVSVLGTLKREGHDFTLVALCHGTPAAERGFVRSEFDGVGTRFVGIVDVAPHDAGQ